MSNDINLLRNQRERSNNSLRILKILRVSSVVLLVIIAITSTTLFVIRSQSSLAYLENEQRSLEAKLGAVEDKVHAYLFVKDRIGNISTILSQRQAFSVLIVAIIQSMSQGVSIDTFSIDKTGVTIGLSSSSLLALGQSIDNLVTLTKNTKQFRKITLSAFSFDGKQGKYVASFGIEVR